jgi:hypothetical protein
MVKKHTFKNCVNELYKLDIIWCVSSTDRSANCLFNFRTSP